MTAHPWKVDLAFEVADMTEWTVGTGLCRSVSADAPCDSGTGFGLRDMQFFFATRAEAEAMVARLRALPLTFAYLDIEGPPS